jgi:hypothetical protein
MLLAEWVGEHQLDSLGKKMVLRGDIVEVHARGAFRTHFACKSFRSAAYFWGDEKNLEWCSPVSAADIVSSGSPLRSKSGVGF